MIAIIDSIYGFHDPGMNSLPVLVGLSLASVL